MGITAGIEAIGSFIASSLATVGTAAGAVGGAATAGAEAIGIPAALAGPVGAGITTGIEGGLTGGVLSGITGHDPIKGFESGALSGFGAGALGPALGAITGSPLIGNALGGALGGTAGAAATGSDLASGALQGGIGGAVKTAFSPSAGAPGGGAASASASAAPAGVPLASPDVTSSVLAPSGATPLGGDVSFGSGGQSAVSSSLPGSFNTGAAAGGSQVSGLSQAPALAPQTSLAPNAPLLSGPLSTTAPTPGAISTGAGGTTAGGFANALKNPTTDMALLLGANALMGNKQSPYAGTLAGIAKQDQMQGAQLESYLTSGTLPPGMQHSLDATKAQQTAALKSEYASHGMSGSSAEVQDTAAIGDKIQAQGISVAENLYQQGVTEMGQAQSIYGTLIQEQIAQDNAFSSSIGNLASALALSSRPITYAGA